MEQDSGRKEGMDGMKKVATETRRECGGNGVSGVNKASRFRVRDEGRW